jgi:release factor glutamine methyltransferase
MAEFHRLRTRDEIEKDNNNNILYSTSSSSSSSFFLSWDDLNEDAEILAKTEPNACMPRLDHLSLRDYDLVYEPADDTFLLLDAIQYEFQSGTLDHHFKNKNIINNSKNKKTIVLEIGCGTGVASVFFRSQWLKRWETLQEDDNNDSDKISSRSSMYRAVDSLLSYATDINPKAIQVTLQTDSYNNGHAFHEDINPIQVVQCDLASDLLSQLQGKVDVLLFNPPYVPTDDCEVVDVTTINYPYDDNDNKYATIHPSPSIITAAWAGGKDGRRVVDRAIPQIAQLLRRPPPPTPNHGGSGSKDDDRAAGITTTTRDNGGSTGGGGSDEGGVLYLVTVDDNRPAQLAAELSASFSLEMKPLFRRRARNEFLTIQKITWNQHQQQQPPSNDDQKWSTEEQPTAITESSSTL